LFVKGHIAINDKAFAELSPVEQADIFIYKPLFFKLSDPFVYGRYRQIDLTGYLFNGHLGILL
jgi:hypothetical protein